MPIYITLLRDFWPYLLTTFTILATVSTATHVVLKKNDSRAAIGWLGLVWFAPVLGVCLYWLFGINRIQRLAKSKFSKIKDITFPKLSLADSPSIMVQIDQNHLDKLCRLSENVTGTPLLNGNTVSALLNGDQAFPQMLQAIDNAQESIALATYIFDNDSWGKKFRSSLRDAVVRGVEVRVLIDSVGARYSFPPIVWGLKRDGIQVTRFMKTILPWRFRYINLRNHRKILVVDGRKGFTGGMNIREGAVLCDTPLHPMQDTHFSIDGPVVAELQRVFAEDWYFSTKEMLEGPKWFPSLDCRGDVKARGIVDGPDEDFDKLRFVMLGAITSAQNTIRIATPYFLPDNELTTALRTAALKGVRVEILLPGTTNLRMVKWASDALLKDLILSGCTIFYTRPPFDHSKLMTVDSTWVLFGSANWDTRSLSLNFEFNVECYDSELTRLVENILDQKAVEAVSISLESLESQCFITRLRNRFFRLFSPYL